MLVSVLSLLTAVSVVSAQSSSVVVPAPKVTGNPIGASYVATLPAKAGSSLAGSISAVTSGDGNGVQFSVSFSGLPATGGPFIYHIHEKPVPSDGNCTGTGAHLDPYKRGEVPSCDATKPETCQVGDLSGKYGNFTTMSFSAQYVDPYVSTRPDSNAFFGNLAFVVHLANKTRIGCANFTMAATPMPSTNATVSMMAPTGTSPPIPQYSGNSAAKIVGGTGAIVAAVAAFFL